MNNDFYRKQLNEIAEITESCFGLADKDGNVLMYAGDTDTQPENIFSSFSGKTLSENDVCFLGDYAVLQLENCEDEVRYIFAGCSRNSDAHSKEAQIRNLKLAAYGFMPSGADEKEKNTEVIESIFEGNYTEKMLKRAQKILGSNLIEAKTLVVFVILPKNPATTEELENILSLTEEILPAEFSAFGTERKVNGNRGIAFICSEKQSEDGQNLREVLGTVADTILSETLTDVWVSAGGGAEGIHGIPDSFSEACEGISIGRTFGLPAKFFDYEAMGLERLIYNLPEKYAREFVEETLGPDFFSDRSAYELLNTVDTFLECSQNGSKASKALYIHRNTLIYRLDKFMNMTGLDCSQFASGLRIKLVMLILKSLGGKQQEAKMN